MLGGVKASADTLGDYVEGDTPQVVENTAESYGFALSVALDVIQGEKSVPDAYAELVEYSLDNGCDNLDLIINGGVIGVDMSPREFVNALTNGIRQGIADGGGQLSDFPVSNTNGDVKRFNLSDGTYVEWYLYDFQYNYGNRGYDYAWWGYNYYKADGGLIETVYANDNSLLGSWVDVPCYAPMGENIWNYVTISIAEVTDTNILWRIDKYVFSSSEDYYTNTKYITQKIENSGLTGEEVITTDDVDNLTDEELIILIDNMIDTLKEIDPNTEETNGLLQAILNQLKKLDSDNDNELLRKILEALKANTVVNSDTTLFKFDTDKVKAYKKQVDGLIDSKFAFVTSVRTFIDNCIKVYSNSALSPSINFSYGAIQHSIDFSVYNEDVINTVRYLAAGFIYLQFAFNLYRRIPSYITNGGDK